ncbi:PIR Superfamily Protein [Plasmodium ovale wallikeri]|uniref:PIR Superfamily Protein n=1 Tax=Plasmodium ovale wallikeri TaxID=864142 RepID=A0A1A9AQR7_PLAOA|nr:PIR Superfamily Protein [Plasmodium ovale wallikeri]
MSIVRKGDIPSKRFFDELKKSIKFDDIIRYIKRNDNSGNIQRWIDKFPEYLENYLKQNEANWLSNNKDKRCSDLNYILDAIINNIEKFKLSNLIKLINDIDTHSINVLKNHKILECYRELHGTFNNVEYYKKRFGLLCEDIEYIILNIDGIINSPDCKAIIANVYIRKNGLMDVFKKIESKHHNVFNSSKECMRKINRLNIRRNCILKKNDSVLHEGGRGLQDQGRASQAGDTAALEEAQMTDALVSEPDGESEDDSGRLDLLRRELEEKEMSPNLKTALSAGSLVGASLISLFLYRATPIGSWIRSTVLPNNKNDYNMLNEGNDNLLSSSIDPLQLNMDNHEYHMSYNSGGGF